MIELRVWPPAIQELPTWPPCTSQSPRAPHGSLSWQPPRTPSARTFKADDMATPKQPAPPARTRVGLPRKNPSEKPRDHGGRQSWCPCTRDRGQPPVRAERLGPYQSNTTRQKGHIPLRPGNAARRRRSLAPCAPRRRLISHASNHALPELSTVYRYDT